MNCFEYLLLVISTQKKSSYMKKVFLALLLTLFVGGFAMAQAPAAHKTAKTGLHKKHHHKHHHHGPKKHM